MKPLYQIRGIKLTARDCRGILISYALFRLRDPLGDNDASGGYESLGDLGACGSVSDELFPSGGPTGIIYKGRQSSL